MRRTDGKAIFVPIDNDRCFGITKDWNVRDGLMYDKVLSKESSNGGQRNPLLNKTIFASDNYCKQLYLAYVKKIVNSSWCGYDAFFKYSTNALISYSKHFDMENNPEYLKLVSKKL